MDSRNAASTYKQSAFDSAPPLKIVHMMYEGALRFLDQAERTDLSSERIAYNQRLGRAEAIVSELRLSLRHEDAPELGRALNALYLFVEGEIREAFLEGDKSRIPSARDVLTTLLDGWKRVEAAD